MFMVKFKKIVLILVIITIILFSLSGSYSTHNIDKLAYVVALGLDVGTSNKLNLSIQLAKPGGSSSGSDSSSEQSSNNIVNSIECSSIESGLNLFNSYISKNLNLSHCKVIVISEELAKDGISEYLYTLTNNVEVSSHSNVVVSKCQAKDFLDSSNPLLEDLSSRYYEIAPTSSEYTGYTRNVTLIKFFSNYVDTYREPVAILGSVNSGSSTASSSPNSSNVGTSISSGSDQSGSGEDSGNSSSSSSSSNNKDGSYKAGETPINSKSTIENMGLAVFRGDKLVGELTGLETVCNLIIDDELKSCNISIPNPIHDSENLDVNLRLNKSTKNNVTFVNGTPYISTNINVKIKILSTTESSTSGNTDYYEAKNVQLIEQSCNEYLQRIISEYLYKTAKEYKSDVNGFGKYAVKYFTTLQKWNEYDWLDNYHNSTFNVNIKSTLKSGFTFI